MIMAFQTIWATNPMALFDVTPRSQFMPVMEWIEDKTTGKRRPSTNQARNPQGVLIWEIKLIGTVDAYGTPEETFFNVRIASNTKPEISQLAKIAMVSEQL